MDHRARSWFEQWTFRAADLEVDEVRRAKAQQRVSVVIPARNEEATIGPIVTAIRQALMGPDPLVDELLVIDSDSTDATSAVARDCGARVHAAVDIAPELGWRAGKGEAMWKSLFVAGGDVVVFVDGDLIDFDPGFVTGLLYPLLVFGQVEMVKGCYGRDLGADPAGIAQGGRVTELMARPLLNRWWPELGGVIQPLAGEWAARRSLLRSLPFPCGYGVECGVLVDTYLLRGLDAIAQVDLGHRAHVHQDLAGLGVMAAEVLAAAERRRFPGAQLDAEQLAQPVGMAGAVSREWVSRSVQAAERPAHDQLARELGLAHGSRTASIR